MRKLVLLATLCAAVYGRDLLTTSADWNWRGAIARGRTVQIRGVTGDIHAVPSSSGQLEVSARIQQDGEVDMHVSEGASGVTVCAVRKGAHACADNPLAAPGSRVDFEVRVPTGVHLAARTVNGAIEAESLTSDVNAETVNGTVVISTTGTATAKTVNGSIKAKLLKPFWRKSPEFSAVNGGISVHIPRNVRTGVVAETRNGRIVSDVPDFRGAATEQTLEGTIGRSSGAGNGLVIRTINGGIELKQRF